MKAGIMQNVFVFWARQLASQSLGMGIEARVTESNMSDNPSARLDIDTPTSVARITCWESGDYDAEVIDVETEQLVHLAHGHIAGGQEFSELFAAFFKALNIAPSDIPKIGQPDGCQGCGKPGPGGTPPG